MKKTIILGALLLSTSLFANNAKQLFESKCMSCHTIKPPKDKSTMVAPPMKGVMFHMVDEIKETQKIREHFNEFVLNPTKEKAICKSVKRFGLMPSLKGQITKEELAIVTDWILKNLTPTPEQFKRMKQNH
jgi:cytochrome c